ncbi:MAG: hypothetical protein PWP53_2067 [Lacrimispora sp.]|nr:hypothetical protein [Lacrimispora sp.]
MDRGSLGWTIYKDIAPLPDEKIFEKQYNSAFRKTGLHEYLQEKGIKKIILCEIQTEYCLDVTCKVAFEYEYEVTIPQSTTTTFDNVFASGKDLSEREYGKITVRIRSHQHVKIVTMIKSIP